MSGTAPIPADALNPATAAAAEEIHERTTLDVGQAIAVAQHALNAALPHLLPGLYVTHDRQREGTDSTIWREVPGKPHLPEELLFRTQANATLFDAVAALLPDRSES